MDDISSGNTTLALEQAVIGAICVDPGLAKMICAIVGPDDFKAFPPFARVLEAARACAGVPGMVFDATTAQHALEAEIGGDRARDVLRGCIDAAPTTANAEYHAKQLHNFARYNRFRAAVASEMAFGGGDPAEIVARVQTLCCDYLSTDSSGGGPVTLAEIYRSLLNAIDGGEVPPVSIDTGYPLFDAVMGGAQAGEVIVIGAGTGVGKSAFALNFALNAAKTAGSVLIFSMEMSARQVGQRILARHQHLTTKMISSAVRQKEQLSADQYSALVSDMAADVQAYPIKVDATPRQSMAYIRRRAMQEPDLRLVVIDYLGLLELRAKDKERYDQALGNAVWDAKVLAGELQIPVILLVQLNRSVARNERPSLEYLRDSGVIANHASKVVLLWQLRQIDDETMDVGVAIDKQRDGATGAFAYRFLGPSMRYEELGYLADYEAANGGPSASRKKRKSIFDKAAPPPPPPPAAEPPKQMEFGADEDVDDF